MEKINNLNESVQEGISTLQQNSPAGAQFNQIVAQQANITPQQEPSLNLTQLRSMLHTKPDWLDEDNYQSYKKVIDVATSNLAFNKKKDSVTVAGLTPQGIGRIHFDVGLVQTKDLNSQETGIVFNNDYKQFKIFASNPNELVMTHDRNEGKRGDPPRPATDEEKERINNRLRSLFENDDLTFKAL